MSYAMDLEDAYARVAALLDRVLKGANPAELPFEQPTRFRFVINLKTAKALGLTVQPLLLARADEVVEWAGQVSRKHPFVTVHASLPGTLAPDVDGGVRRMLGGEQTSFRLCSSIGRFGGT